MEARQWVHPERARQQFVALLAAHHILGVALAELLRSTPCGQLRGPEQLGPGDWVVFRVDSFQGCRIDDPSIAQRLLQLEADAWLEERLQRWLSQQATRS
ncbi:MAG: hypothetical protein VKK62_05825 [Synechococcaceae cyanobacterium]|nr:hypothetical protein [Synechococcaceae cyanobacterium]